MNRSKIAPGVIALATFGTGIGWLLSVQGSRTSVNIRPETVPEYGAEQTIALSPAPPTVVDISSSKGRGDAAELPSAPTPEASPGVSLAELEKEYGDPTIARGAKLTIQRVLDAKLDQSRYQVHAVICHEQNCQIFSNPLLPGAEGDWPPIVETMLQELEKASFRNPETGAELKPTLEAMSRGRPKGAVTLTIIWLR